MAATTIATSATVGSQARRRRGGGGSSTEATSEKSAWLRQIDLEVRAGEHQQHVAGAQLDRAELAGHVAGRPVDGQHGGVVTGAEADLSSKRLADERRLLRRSPPRTAVRQAPFRVEQVGLLGRRQTGDVLEVEHPGRCRRRRSTGRRLRAPGRDGPRRRVT